VLRIQPRSVINAKTLITLPKTRCSCSRSSSSTRYRDIDYTLHIKIFSSISYLIRHRIAKEVSISPSQSAMQIKRKRSTDSPSTSSSTSTPPQSSSTTTSSRTLKRYRDNRPSEEIIHATTMQKMYAAQRLGHAAEPLLSEPILDVDAQPDSGYGQKRLEAFWRVPETQMQSRSASQTWTKQQSWHGPKCEDCDAPVVDPEDIASGMSGADYKMSGTGTGEVQGGGCCGGCGRRVCGLCSLVREQRVCLECAGKGFT